jgi:hypothetical protein
LGEGLPDSGSPIPERAAEVFRAPAVRRAADGARRRARHHRDGSDHGNRRRARSGTPRRACRSDDVAAVLVTFRFSHPALWNLRERKENAVRRGFAEVLAMEIPDDADDLDVERSRRSGSDPGLTLV